jgi:hypothetical protein
MLAPVLVAEATHYKVGNERQEEYRAPWPERILFERSVGCPVFADTSFSGYEDCTGHTPGVNQWAIDMNGYNRDECSDALKATRNGDTLFFEDGDIDGYGNTIGVRHVAFNGGPTSSWYSHLETPTSAAWDDVFLQGDYIGTVGTTDASGCHLHFQLNGGHTPPPNVQSLFVGFSGTPLIDGFGVDLFSCNQPYPFEPSIPCDGEHPFASNNTGPGYCRPGAPAHLDPGPADTPCSTFIRQYVRILAVSGVDYGSTKASSRGACGANRRWVKTCQAGAWGTIRMQGFVKKVASAEHPAVLVEGPTVFMTHSVDGAFWKAYYRKFAIGGVSKYAYEWLGRPITEDQVYTLDQRVQYFDGGSILVDYQDPSNIIVYITVHGLGTLIQDHVLETNNDPCYDLSGDWVVNSGDNLLLAQQLGKNETNPLYDDRYDLNRDGGINSGDQFLMATQLSPPLQCR